MTPEEGRKRNERFAKTIALLEWYGINPKQVAEEGFDINGYSEFVLDENGKHVFSEDGTKVAVLRHEWPSPAVALELVEQFIQDRTGLS